MKNKNFTLIELLVVISIIAILAALVIPALSKARRSVKERTAKSQMLAIKTALKAYKNEFRMYPNPSNDLIYTDIGDVGGRKSEEMFYKLWSGRVRYWDGALKVDADDPGNPELSVIPDAWWDDDIEDHTGMYRLRYDEDTKELVIFSWGDDQKSNTDEDKEDDLEVRFK